MRQSLGALLEHARPGAGGARQLASRLLTRRRGLVALGAGLVPALAGAVAVAGRTSRTVAIEADDVLLVPANFTGANLREMQRLGQRVTRDGSQTAQVVLEDGRVQIFQGVVVFRSEDAARAAFQAISQEGTGERWKVVPTAPALGQESVVLVGKQGDQDAISTVFRQGQVLVRMTVVGSGELPALLPYARKAEEKVKERGVDND